MERPPLQHLHGFMKGVTEKRQRGKIRHKLEDILFIAVVGTLANAGSWSEIADFAQARLDWLRKYIELPNGAPSHDTLERAFKWIDGKEFERCFILWMKEISQKGPLRMIAIDGKTMRGSADKANGRNPLHIVSAWVGESNLVLGQIMTEEKSNEITAIPLLLDMLDVSGGIVTIDAMGTQRKIAERIISGRADYVLSLKKNQPTMLDDVQTYFEEELKENFRESAHEYHRTLEKGHGRIEKREYWLVNTIEWIDWKKDWPKLGGIGMVRRTITRKKEETVEIAYYITSLKENAVQFAKAVRNHWGIESMHWSLDVVRGEDRRIVRKENGPRNLAVLKRMALNIIRADTSFENATGPRKRFRASMNLEYLESIIQGM